VIWRRHSDSAPGWIALPLLPHHYTLWSRLSLRSLAGGKVTLYWNQSKLFKLSRVCCSPHEGKTDPKYATLSFTQCGYEWTVTEVLDEEMDLH